MITQKSLDVFLSYARSAGDWSGTPMVGGTAAERGNLTQLKNAGLITTFPSDGDVFIQFTETGRALAAEHGIAIPE
jgi:hypothetical protein